MGAQRGEVSRRWIRRRAVCFQPRVPALRALKKDVDTNDPHRKPFSNTQGERNIIFKVVRVNKVGKGKHIPKGHHVQGKEGFKNFHDNAKEKEGLRLGTGY